MVKKIVILFLALLFFVSCSDKEEEYLSYGHIVSSVDTINFGRNIAGELSPTQSFVLRNSTKNKQTIQLKNAEVNGASPFMVNVDGIPLKNGQLYDFEILPHDSIFVFCALKTPHFDTTKPVEINGDFLWHTEEGKEQKVILHAESQKVRQLKALTISDKVIFDSACPYQILDSLIVKKGGQLIVKAGTQIYFHHQAYLKIYGHLSVEGTIDSNVVMRGDRLGYMLSKTPYDVLPNQWGGIIFAPESKNNKISNADIHGGAYGVKVFSNQQKQVNLILRNSVIHNTAGDNFYAQNANVQLVNCQITNAGRNCVRIIGGKYVFVQCTVAQFYPFKSDKEGAFFFSNTEEETLYPLLKLDVFNSIITGNASDDIHGEKNDEATFNYLFAYSLLNTPKTDDDPHFSNCKWRQDDPEDFTPADNFAPDFDYKQLLFSFQLSEKSQAIETANSEYAIKFAPKDRLGRSRIDTDTPDMGCYQHVESIKEEE